MTCPPCTRLHCPARRYPGADRLPTFRQLDRWTQQHLARTRRASLADRMEIALRGALPWVLAPVVALVLWWWL